MKTGSLHQIGRTDRPRPKAKMRGRSRTGLLRVVDKKPLCVAGSLLADDLDRVLVRADGTVRAKTVKHAADDLFPFGHKGAIVWRLVCETSSLIPTVK